MKTNITKGALKKGARMKTTAKTKQQQQQQGSPPSKTKHKH